MPSVKSKKPIPYALGLSRQVNANNRIAARVHARIAAITRLQAVSLPMVALK